MKYIRYIEMMKTDYNSPSRYLSSGSNKPVINNITWYLVQESYLQNALVGGLLPNLEQTYYWTGFSGKRGFWMFFTTIFYYMHKTTGVKDDTSDSGKLYGIRLGRGI